MNQEEQLGKAVVEYERAKLELGKVERELADLKAGVTAILEQAQASTDEPSMSCGDMFSLKAEKIPMTVVPAPVEQPRRTVRWPSAPEILSISLRIWNLKREIACWENKCERLKEELLDESRAD